MGVWLAVILLGLSIEARAQPFSHTLSAGDATQCATFLELMQHPRSGSFGMPWRDVARELSRPRAHADGTGSVHIASPDDGIILRFRHWGSLKETVDSGMDLTFTFMGWDHEMVRQAMRRLPAIAECETFETQPIEACILGEERLAARFGLPDLKASRTIPLGTGRTRFGNSFYFYQFQGQHWLLIHPSGYGLATDLFGFRLGSVEAIARGQTDALFDVGCQLQRSWERRRR